MLPSLLDGELARICDETLAGIISYPVVLIRSVSSGPPYDPVLTPVEYQCRGWLDQFDAQWLTSALVQAGDVRVIIMAESLAVMPEAGDQVRVRGVTYRVVKVVVDPAQAAWELQARR